MFLGSYTPSFDSKARRIALPKRIRIFLAKDEVVLSLGFERCLFGFDTKTWHKESTRQLSLPLTERHSRDIRRLIFSGATVIKLDDQGRCVIPGNLLAFTKIKRPVIIGAGDHFEIWDQKIWKQEQSRLEGFQK